MQRGQSGTAATAQSSPSLWPSVATPNITQPPHSHMPRMKWPAALMAMRPRTVSRRRCAVSEQVCRAHDAPPAEFAWAPCLVPVECCTFIQTGARLLYGTCTHVARYQQRRPGRLRVQLHAPQQQHKSCCTLHRHSHIHCCTWWQVATGHWLLQHGCYGHHPVQQNGL
jgi:hypothetical protein